MEYKEWTIAKIINISPKIKIFVLESIDNVVPPYLPGNFFLLNLNDDSGVQVFRPYSVASHPNENSLMFAIKLKGRFTSLIFKRNVGDKIHVSGPYGLFSLNPLDYERVFICGGVGISPIRSMVIQTIFKEGKKATLFHSSHDLEGLVFFDEMKKISKESSLRYFPFISGNEKPQAWGGFFGRINADVIKQHVSDIEKKTFYLCGPPEMVSFLTESLFSIGVSKKSIIIEKW